MFDPPKAWAVISFKHKFTRKKNTADFVRYDNGTVVIKPLSEMQTELFTGEIISR